MKTIGGSLPRRFKATASGAITAGKPVIVEAGGTVAEISESTQALGSVTKVTDDTNWIAVGFDSTNNKIVVAYRDGADSNKGKAVVGTVSDTSISYGSPVEFESGETTHIHVGFDENAGKIVIAYRDSGNSSYGTAVVGTVSGTSISFGTPVVFKSAFVYMEGSPSICYHADQQKMLIAYTITGLAECVAGTVSGTSISFGTASIFNGTTAWASLAYHAASTNFVVTYVDTAAGSVGTARVGTLSGTTVAFPGNEDAFEPYTCSNTAITYDSSAEKCIIAVSSSNSPYAKYVVATVSGTTLSTPQAPAQFTESTYVIDFPSVIYDPDANKTVFAWEATGRAGTTEDGTLRVGTLSGDTLSFGSAVIYGSGHDQYNFSAYDSAQKRVVIVYRDAADTSDGDSVVFRNAGISTLTSENYIGIAEYAAADTETATVFIKGGVSTAGGTALDPPTAGTAVEFEDGGTGTYQAIVYDPDSNKVVIAYTDAGDSNKGKAVVGTVSGTSISFGTPVEFEAGGTGYIVATYDTNSNKVVIAYSDAGNSLYGTAIVGTVSGTSISFGTAVVYNAGEVTYQGIAFDSSNNKVVICYRDNANTNYATAIVGTVSGTSISFGTEVVYNSANSLYNVATFDSTNSKVVIAYRDGGNSNYGTAIVGTVSGTSISFGSEAVFSGTSSTQWMGATFDSTNGKVVLAYRNDGSTQTDAVVGTVSGTSISFGTPVLVLDGNNTYHALSFDSVRGEVGLALREITTNDLEFFVGTVSGTSISFGTALEVAGNVEYSPVAYDSSAQKFVVSYHDNDDSSKGKAAVVSTTFSMTPGQTYFVQADGTLGLTADDPSVTAGTAVTSTKLIVKG